MNTLKKQKYYVVWVGIEPGVYDNWEDAAEQVLTYPGAKYKSFNSQREAINAFRGDDAREGKFLLNMFNRPAKVINYEAFPDIDTGAIAVDAACSGNPGDMEYRCVEVATGKEIFHQGPFSNGTNNIGEYLALVHALALCEQQGDTSRRIYTDSVTAMAWLRARHSRSTLQATPENAALMNLVARADRWLASHTPRNPVAKWETEKWGEITADFGRK